MLLTWKQYRITYSTSANRSFEEHPSESAPKEPDTLSLWCGAELTPTLNLCSHQWHLCDPWEGWSRPLIISPLFPQSADNSALAKVFIWIWELIFHRQVVIPHTSPAGHLPSGCLVPLLWALSPAHQSVRGEGWRDTQTFKTFCVSLQESNGEDCYEIFARWESSSPTTLVNL